jgi:cyclohexadieny/prephenate dehydrogenase
MPRKTLSIIGVGLLGGSVALAARQRRVVDWVVGFDRPQVLERAVARDILDEAVTDLSLAVTDADLVVFCTPVNVIVDQVREAVPYCRPGAVLTDVGSTKSSIVQALGGWLEDRVAFVGSHPLAGSEKSGPEYARADLFENRLVVVTPGPHSPEEAVLRVMGFWHALGASVKPMDAQEHDRALGTTSHLPHAVASVLAASLPEEWRSLTATGFRDTTRIAAGNAELWRAIFESNREAVLEALERFGHLFESFRAALANKDSQKLLELLERGKQVRDSLGK